MRLILESLRHAECIAVTKVCHTLSKGGHSRINSLMATVMCGAISCHMHLHCAYVQQNLLWNVPQNRHHVICFAFLCFIYIDIFTGFIGHINHILQRCFTYTVAIIWYPWRIWLELDSKCMINRNHEDDKNTLYVSTWCTCHSNYQWLLKHATCQWKVSNYCVSLSSQLSH